eukprot:GFUD01127105.1.p1 GENE.GFUD01127105.1~~GFUD01127105.1.p1  ORF type:complete len:234 (+),score=70.89 GFUD01127105.1:51-752(+)
MEVESEMDAVIYCIRYLFVDAVNMLEERRAQLLQGNFIPIPSLRSLAFQFLVVNMDTFLIEEFLPGEGYEEEVRNHRLLTRDCVVGKYSLVSMNDSCIFADKTEATEEEKIKNFREEALNNWGPVEVVKMRANEWEMKGLFDFSPARYFKHVKLQQSQEWIEGTTLVFHVEYPEEVDGEEGENVEEKFVAESRVLVTFFKDQFVYEERAVKRRKSKCESYSYEYNVEAWYAKI